MPKGTKTEKWMSYSKVYETSQDLEEDEFDDIRSSFRTDYSKLNNSDKEELWNLFLTRKQFTLQKNDHYDILSEMYNDDTLDSYSILSDEQMEMLDKVDEEVSDLQIPGFEKLFSVVPYIMLEKVIEHFKVFCWNKFNKLNISSLNNESTLRILDDIRIFGYISDIYQLNHIFEIIPKPSFHLLSSDQLADYLKRFAKDLKTPILKKLEISHDYLFCPELVESILPLITNDHRTNISKNIVDTHQKLIVLKAHGFVIPEILNTNILHLKKIINN